VKRSSRHIVVQLIVISTYWSRDAFALMLNLTSAMNLIPFLLVAAYGLQLARRGEPAEPREQGGLHRLEPTKLVVSVIDVALVL
jgi:amino acid transporter